MSTLKPLDIEHPSYTCNESAWVMALNYALHAETVRTFAKILAEWLLLFPDAAEIVANMNDIDLVEFRRGMQMEREGFSAGAEFYENFGALGLPANAIYATKLAKEMKVPWGTAVIRLAEVRP